MRIEGSASPCSSATVYSRPLIHDSANTLPSTAAAVA